MYTENLEKVKQSETRIIKSKEDYWALLGYRHIIMSQSFPHQVLLWDPKLKCVYATMRMCPQNTELLF